LQTSPKPTIVALYSGAMPGNALMANHSLNRTLCGGPILGSKSLAQNQPTAKCRLA